MMRAEICSHCGQPIPPTGLHLPPIKQRIYDAVQRCPDISAEELRCVVWADDPNGGPEFENVVSVHIKHMRPTLEREGVTISCARGPGATYRLEQPEMRNDRRRNHKPN